MLCDGMNSGKQNESIGERLKIILELWNLDLPSERTVPKTIQKIIDKI